MAPINVTALVDKGFYSFPAELFLEAGPLIELFDEGPVLLEKMHKVTCLGPYEGDCLRQVVVGEVLAELVREASCREPRKGIAHQDCRPPWRNEGSVLTHRLAHIAFLPRPPVLFATLSGRPDSNCRPAC